MRKKNAWWSRVWREEQADLYWTRSDRILRTDETLWSIQGLDYGYRTITQLCYSVTVLNALQKTQAYILKVRNNSLHPFDCSYPYKRIRKHTQYIQYSIFWRKSLRHICCVKFVWGVCLFIKSICLKPRRVSTECSTMTNSGLWNHTKYIIPEIARTKHQKLFIITTAVISPAKAPPTVVYLSFFLGRNWEVCPHFFLRQLTALGGRRA